MAVLFSNGFQYREIWEIRLRSFLNRMVGEYGPPFPFATTHSDSKVVSFLHPIQLCLALKFFFRHILFLIPRLIADINKFSVKIMPSNPTLCHKFHKAIGYDSFSAYFHSDKQ